MPADHPLYGEFRRLRREGRVADLQLERLSAGASRELIHALGDGVPEDVAEQMAERTGGSPLFLIALLQNLFEEGLLHVDASGHWAATDEIAMPLPGTVRETIEARLRHLGREQRQIFDLAAVLGGEFSFALLQQASGEPEDPLLELVDSLLDAGLVVEPRTMGREEFAVSHDFYVQVAYDTLPAVRRRRLHRAAAEALLALKPDDPGARAELAYHFHRAGELVRAAHFAQLAGEHALHLYAGQRALLHIEDALRWREEAGLVADEALEAQLHFSLGDALRLAGRYDQALGHFAQALPAVEGQTKLAAAFHVVTLAAMQGQGTGLGHFAEMAPALERELVSMGRTWALAGFRWMQGYLLAIQGHWARGRQCTAEGWRLARQLLERGEPAPEDLHAWAYLVLARAHDRWSDWRQTLHYAGKSLARYVAQENLYGIAASHVTRAAALYGLGDWRAALEACQRCIELATEADDPRWRGEALYFAGLVYLEQGDYPRAQLNAQQVLATARSTGDLLRGGLAQILLARLAIQRGMAEEAMPFLESLVKTARVASAESYAVLALRHLAEAHLRAGDLVAATATAREGLALAQRSGMKRERCGCWQVLGVALARAGDRQMGELRLQGAARLAERIGCRYELDLARDRLEELDRA
jgi:tetratricopeptide (TPR) repeat protein